MFSVFHMFGSEKDLREILNYGVFSWIDEMVAEGHNGAKKHLDQVYATVIM